MFFKWPMINDLMNNAITSGNLLNSHFRSFSMIGIYIYIIFTFISCKNDHSSFDNKKISVSDTISKKAFVEPDWLKSANIYEVNIRQYTPEGTMNAFAKHLPRLKDMGVDILWLMPVFPISKAKRKGPMGSYYAVANYKTINPDLGTMDDFKNLVEKIHHLGMKVILDWVPNHTGWDNPWITNHPEWYTQDANNNIIHPTKTDWTDVADLNYESNDMKNAMVDAYQFWLKKGIDGFRNDMAGMVPLDFWIEMRPALEKIKPDVFMLAEWEDEPLHFDVCFNMNYAWKFHHLLNDIAKEEKDAQDVYKLLTEERKTFPENAIRMRFVTNHDENAWAGSAPERMGKAAKALTILAHTFEGMPLIYSGQEAGLNRKLKFFEKDEIDWTDLSEANFYKELLTLKHKNKALWNGTQGGKIQLLPITNHNILGFIREKSGDKVIVIINLSATAQRVAFATNQLTRDNYIDIFTKEEYQLKHYLNNEFSPWQYIVWSNKVD